MTEEDANDKGLMAGLAAHTKAAGAGTPRRPRQLTRIHRYALRQPDFIPNATKVRHSDEGAHFLGRSSIRSKISRPQCGNSARVPPVGR